MFVFLVSVIGYFFACISECFNVLFQNPNGHVGSIPAEIPGRARCHAACAEFWEVTPPRRGVGQNVQRIKGSCNMHTRRMVPLNVGVTAYHFASGYDIVRIAIEPRLRTSFDYWLDEPILKAEMVCRRTSARKRACFLPIYFLQTIRFNQGAVRCQSCGMLLSGGGINAQYKIDTINPAAIVPSANVLLPVSN